MAATRLPVLVDGDTGYGDVKNVAHTIDGYEAMGASAIFIEDQVAPKRCGHMAGKDVIAADQMVAKIKAAVGARRSKDFFIIARTDARAVHGLDEALRRGEQYLKAGADGIFIEAPQTVQELERVGRAFNGVPQIANMLEGGGQTPVLPPAELKAMGFAMAAYPTTLIFRVARTIERALADIKAGKASTATTASTSPSSRTSPTTTNGRASRTHTAAPRGACMRRVGLALLALALPSPLARHARAQTKVRLAVGGQNALYYLPLTVTDRLGYFKDEGLDVEISDLAGGAKALQALIGGSADVVTGAFDHTIQMQAKGQPIEAVVQLGRFPGFVLALVGPKAASYQGPADLKGMKIGVTAPGSSTHFMALHMMAQAGLKPDDASFIGVGAGPTAIAAAKRGEIDALVNVDPVINLLESEKAIRDRRRHPDDGRHAARSTAAPTRPRCSICPPAYAQSNPEDRAVADQRLRARPEMDRQPFRRGHRQGDAGGIRARQHGHVRPLDPQQHSDVFAGRPIRPRERRDRAEGAARVRPRRARRQDRPREDLHRSVPRQGRGEVRYA